MRHGSDRQRNECGGLRTSRECRNDKRRRLNDRVRLIGKLYL